MKRKLLIATVALASAAGMCCGERSSQTAAAPPSKTHQLPAPTVREGQGFANPLDVMLADPYIYHEKNEYFLYGTAGTGGTRVWTAIFTAKLVRSSARSKPGSVRRVSSI